MRVLVIYATKCGATRGIAKAICDELRAEGDAVTILPVGEAVEIAPFDAIVVGSAVRQRRWLKPASDFLRANREQLAERAVAYFSVCLAVVHESSLGASEAARYRRIPEELAPEVTPVANGVFAGTLDESALTPGERLYVKAFGVPPGDYRDWDAIRAWARQTHSALAGARVPARV